MGNVVIGTSPSTGEVLVKDTNTGAMSWQPGSTEQIQSATQQIQAMPTYDIPTAPQTTGNSWLDFLSPTPSALQGGKPITPDYQTYVAPTSNANQVITNALPTNVKPGGGTGIDLSDAYVVIPGKMAVLPDGTYIDLTSGMKMDTATATRELAFYRQQDAVKLPSKPPTEDAGTGREWHWDGDQWVSMKPDELSPWEKEQIRISEERARASDLQNQQQYGLNQQQQDWLQYYQQQQLALQQQQWGTQQQQTEQQYQLDQQRLAWEQQQATAQQAQERQQYLSNLAAQPKSWLEYAAASGATPMVQPWMLPLMPQQYAGTVAGAALPGWQGVQTSIGQGMPTMAELPSLTTPSTQYQARMGPTAYQQYAGYEQARTGISPTETQFRLWSQAPPSGQFQQLRYAG
jgi:hypothetical protein